MAWYGTNRTGAYIRVCQTDPKIRLRLPHDGAAEVLQDGHRLVLLPTLAFFALWDGTGDGFVVARSTAPLPAAALPVGSYAAGQVVPSDAAAASGASLGPCSATAPGSAGPPSPRRQPNSPGSPDPAQGDSQHAPAPVSDNANQDAPIHVHSDDSERDGTSSKASESSAESAETVGSSNCDPQEPDAVLREYHALSDFLSKGKTLSVRTSLSQWHFRDAFAVHRFRCTAGRLHGRSLPLEGMPVFCWPSAQGCPTQSDSLLRAWQATCVPDNRDRAH